MLIRLADRTIRIEHLHSYTEKLCREYIIEDDGLSADINVRIEAADIDYERERSDGDYPDDYLESLAVYRKISEGMPAYDTFLFHSSALAVDGEAYIFTASSGTGKSTHACLWREMLGDRAVMINDDKPLIRIEGDKAYVYGTPWDGKHRLSNNVSFPLKAVCIIKQGKINRIVKTGPADAMPMLIQQSYRPADRAAMAETLKLIDRMVSCVDLYSMECNMDPEAARIAYETMRG